MFVLCPIHTHYCFDSLFSHSSERQTRVSETIFRAARQPHRATHWSSQQLAFHTPMPHLSAEAKHRILLEFAARDTTRSFAALAQRHGVAGGARVVRRWYARWDGTQRSLERKAGTGRAPLLSRAEVSRHVRAPILAANRSHRAIRYTDLLPEVRRKTGKQLSIQTLRRYGKAELGARDKHTKKRTADESEHTTYGRKRSTRSATESASSLAV